MCLDKYQKSSASDYPKPRDMVNGSKDCRNLKGGTFIIFIDHCGNN